MTFLKKLLSVLILLAISVFSSCSSNGTLEEYDADAPATVKDERTLIQTSPYTGRKPLDPIKFSVSDPENNRNLSIERIEHAFGAAKNGKPHEIAESAQKFFEKTGYKTFCYDTKTKEKVLYLTFDCGWENGYTAAVLDTLKEKNVSAAFFCTLDHIKSEPKLIARMINEGHIVGNHSAKHPDFSKISRQRMADEILECDSFLREKFGYSAPFFRFPEGAYTENALELVDSMGYTSVFWSCSYADWDAENPKGSDYAFEKITSRLHPGAVILLHSVSPDNAEALGRIIDFARQNGYEFHSLEEYIA